MRAGAGVPAAVQDDVGDLWLAKMVPPAEVRVYERRVPLKLMAAQENELRLLEIERDDSTRTLADDALTSWARVLEVSLFFASFHDASSLLGIRTIAESIQAFDRVDALVVTLSRLDPRRVMAENEELLRPYRALVPRASEAVTVDTGAVVRSVESLLVHCPMDELDTLGREHGLAEVGHRCRLAHDGLRAFVARHRHPNEAAMLAAGQIYAEGRATVEEVAAVLELSVPDVVALLEEHGFRRSVDGLRLSEDARNERLRLIRDERIARGGEPAPSAAHVARDVIASQRIEGIDARPWLHR